MARDEGAGAGSVVLAFLVGAVGGAAVALLYAPATGAETREFLGEKAREGRERAARRPNGDARRQARAREPVDRHRARARGLSAGAERRQRVNTWSVVFLGVIAVATLATAIVQIGCSSPPGVWRGRSAGSWTRSSARSSRSSATSTRCHATPLGRLPSRWPRSNAWMRSCRTSAAKIDQTITTIHSAIVTAGPRGPRMDRGASGRDGGDPRFPEPAARPYARRRRRPLHLASGGRSVVRSSYP